MPQIPQMSPRSAGWPARNGGGLPPPAADQRGPSQSSTRIPGRGRPAGTRLHTRENIYATHTREPHGGFLRRASWTTQAPRSRPGPERGNGHHYPPPPPPDIKKTTGGRKISVRKETGREEQERKLLTRSHSGQPLFSSRSVREQAGTNARTSTRGPTARARSSAGCRSVRQK